MTDFDGRLTALRQRFVASLPAEADHLEQAMAKQDRGSARRIAHGLAGRSGLFGFEDLGEIAKRCDGADPDGFDLEAMRLLSALRSLDSS